VIVEPPDYCRMKILYEAIIFLTIALIIAMGLYQNAHKNLYLPEPKKH
jgi:hypothetical protein